MNILRCISNIASKNIGLILIAFSIVIAALIYAYFNPYQSCKRDLGYNKFQKLFAKSIIKENNKKTAFICSGSVS
ncbi:hypothetical protein N9A15_05490 [Candidatus Pelagibacter sp.]|nr:hypothetical protein [Candidatus Pelagibacter sp.]